MKIYILMKNGWPVAAFDTAWLADNSLSAAQENEPNNHWMTLVLDIQETY